MPLLLQAPGGQKKRHWESRNPTNPESQVQRLAAKLHSPCPWQKELREQSNWHRLPRVLLPGTQSQAPLMELQVAPFYITWARGLPTGTIGPGGKRAKRGQGEVGLQQPSNAHLAAARGAIWPGEFTDAAAFHVTGSTIAFTDAVVGTGAGARLWNTDAAANVPLKARVALALAIAHATSTMASTLLHHAKPDCPSR
jgi:hypothetical protein